MDSPFRLSFKHVECQQCRIQDKFYEDVRKKSKEDDSYFGMISYVNFIISSNQSKYDIKPYLPKICIYQLIKEWEIRGYIRKQIKRNGGLISEHIKKRRKSDPKASLYIPEHTEKLVTIKKSESFTESPPDIKISENLVETKGVYKCKERKKSSSKEKVAQKEPGKNTLKRKRYNLAKLKTDESYEDDLFEEKKFKPVPFEDSNTSDEKPTTPQWSVHVSPRILSPAPSFEDCCSLSELEINRKEAEEYQYYRNKRRKLMPVCKEDDATTIMKEDPETYRRLLAARAKLKKERENEEEEENQDEKDHYFSDLEDSDF